MRLDERTKKYFEKIRKNIGWESNNAGWYDFQEILDSKAPGEIAELIATYDGFANSTDIKIYAYNKNNTKKYCAEFSYQTDIDDYCIETHIFNKKPTLKDVLTAVSINDLTFDFDTKRLNQIFTCWECGRKCHWLDIDGDLETKKERLKDEYCGC